MILVGANVAVARVLADALPIPVILFLRCGLASLLLLPFAFTFRPAFLPPRALLGNLLLQAALGTLLYNIALLAGLRRTGALEGGLVLASLPAVKRVHLGFGSGLEGEGLAGWRALRQRLGWRGRAAVSAPRRPISWTCGRPRTGCRRTR